MPPPGEVGDLVVLILELSERGIRRSSLEQLTVRHFDGFITSYTDLLYDVPFILHWGYIVIIWYFGRAGIETWQGKDDKSGLSTLILVLLPFMGIAFFILPESLHLITAVIWLCCMVIQYSLGAGALITRCCDAFALVLFVVSVLAVTMGMTKQKPDFAFFQSTSWELKTYRWVDEAASEYEFSDEQILSYLQNETSQYRGFYLISRHLGDRVLSTEIHEFLIDESQREEKLGLLTINDSNCWTILRDQERLGQLSGIDTPHREVYETLKALLAERQEMQNKHIRRDNARRKREAMMRDKLQASPTPNAP